MSGIRGPQQANALYAVHIQHRRYASAAHAFDYRIFQV